MSWRGPLAFNRLPYELQREVFVAATYNEPSSALRLVLVARRVNNWIQPFIYNLVTLGAKDTTLFLQSMNSKSPEFLATHVKHLCLSVSVNAVDATRILTACTGVVNLALWVDFLSVFPKGHLAPLIASLSLRRLSIEYAHLIDVLSTPASVHPAWYTTLTHLDIVFWRHHEAPDIPGLDRLTSLTHIALGLHQRNVDENSANRILSRCSGLKMLVLLLDEDAQDEPFASTDARIFYLPYPSAVVQNWEASWKGLPDTWSVAQTEFLRRQEGRKAAGLVTTAETS